MQQISYVTIFYRQLTMAQSKLKIWENIIKVNAGLKYCDLHLSELALEYPATLSH